MSNPMAISSKQRYYELIQNPNYKFDDVLKDIPELSYSKKLEIMEGLLEEHTIIDVKKALVIYKKSYIDIGKVDLTMIKGVLSGLCVIARIYEGRKR